jgi:hypothetical protein
LALEVNGLRRQAVEDDDGPLNFTTEMAAIRRRFVRRLADTFSRASSIASNLRLLWGWTAITDPPDPSTWTDPSNSYLDALSDWAISLERTLQPLFQGESSTVISLSMKNLCGKTNWDAAIAAVSQGAPTLQLKFRLSADAMAGFNAARLRGAAAAVITTSGLELDTWRGRLQLPVTAWVAFNGGAGAPVEQPIAAVDLGRIQAVNPARIPDVAGTSIFRNASALSDPNAVGDTAACILNIEAQSISGASAAKLTDVQLDLYIAGMPG